MCCQSNVKANKGTHKPYNLFSIYSRSFARLLLIILAFSLGIDAVDAGLPKVSKDSTIVSEMKELNWTMGENKAPLFRFLWRARF